MTRPTVTLSNLGRQRNNATNTYVSHCNHCRRAIHQHHDYKWYSRPFIGYLHVKCAERAVPPPVWSLEAE